MLKGEEQYITNTNDRLRLVLYRYISYNRGLSFLESFEFKRLENIYVDNSRYAEYLDRVLLNRGFIKCPGRDSYQDENGYWVTDMTTKGYIITELGERALKSGLLPSEMRKDLINILKDWIPIISSLIAIVISIFALKK